MKLIVTGSRNWTDSFQIRSALDIFTAYQGYPNTLVHGDCSSGADFIADQIGMEGNDQYLVSWDIVRYPADWSQGKKAGPERNRRMIDENLDADYVLAFPLGESRGTRHCMNYAASKGLTVVNLGER